MNLENYIKKLLFSAYSYRTRRRYNKKIDRIARNSSFNKNYDSKLISRHQKKWDKLKKKVNPIWFKVYRSLSGMNDPNFVPEDIYYTIIEPILNNKAFDAAYGDKNFYDMHYSFPGLFPKVFIRNLDGVFYDNNYNDFDLDNTKLHKLIENERKVIVKPSYTSGGRNIELFVEHKCDFQNSRGKTLTKEYLNKNYDMNYVIQEYIHQHSYFERFNSSSVNTVRLMTYRSIENEKIIILSAVLRVGKEGMIVDNQASGGISCGIENGHLKNYFVDKYGNQYETKNIVDEELNLHVRHIEEIFQMAKKVAKANPYHRILGLDFCIDENDQIRLLEVNNTNIEINFLQMNNGPLFGDYTEEVINFCSGRKRTFNLNISSE